VEGVPYGCVRFTDRVPRALKNPACVKVDRLDQFIGSHRSAHQVTRARGDSRTLQPAD
jgi:hypothetical protein